MVVPNAGASRDAERVSEAGLARARWDAKQAHKLAQVCPMYLAKKCVAFYVSLITVAKGIGCRSCTCCGDNGLRDGTTPNGEA